MTLACCQRAMLRMCFDAPSAASVIIGKTAHVCWIHCVQRATSLRVFCEFTLSNSHSDIAVIMERSFMSGASANFATARTAMPCATARRSRLLLCSSLMLGNCDITVSMYCRTSFFFLSGTLRPPNQRTIPDSVWTPV